LVGDEPANLIAALDAGRNRTEQGFTFVATGGREDFVSWDRLRSEAINCAAHLRASGLRQGDRLALVMPAARDFVPTFLGAVWAGIVPAPFHAPASPGNPASYLASLAGALEKIQPAYLATTGKVAEEIRGDVRLAASLSGIVTAEALKNDAPDSYPCEPIEVAGDDVVFLQFTSGSTGGPRAVEITHASLRANAWAIMRENLKADSDRDHGVSWLPLTHDMGLIGFVLSPLFHKIQVTFIPTTSFVRNASVWLDTIHQKRATISFAPNFAFALTTKRAHASHLSKWDLSCVRALGCGAEPINPATMRGFIEKFAPCGLRPEAILPCYGMAEATLAISFGRLDEVFSLDLIARSGLLEHRRAIPVATPEGEDVVEMVCCGPPLHGHEVAAFDERGQRLGPRQVGELWMRGPSVARGYHGDPEASRLAFSGGWLRTGDLGYIADGSVHVTGRKKDLIIINGRNYDPQRIEWLLDGVPAVRNGSGIAFSVPGPATEELVIFVESRTREPEALQVILRSRIATELQLIPSKIVVSAPGTLPRTVNGKRRRAVARQQYLDATVRQAPTDVTAGKPIEIGMVHR
jgi:fatty-acyl-CoA synthase